MKTKQPRNGFVNISVVLALTALGYVANLAFLYQLPHPVWCMACTMATTYRLFRVARS